MATSGYFITSDSGQGGGGYYGQLVFEWWRTASGISGSSGYHHYSFTLKTWGGSSGYWQYCYNTSMNVDGQGYSTGTVQAYGAGATTLLSGSKTAYTNSAGNRSFGASAQAGIYTASINTSGSGSWAFDNIPMNATITGASSINDEGTPSLSYSNPAGGSNTMQNAWLEINPSNDHYASRTIGSATSGTYNWSLTETERNQLRAEIPNAKTATIRYGFINSITGNASYVDRTYTIVNANPVFTSPTYKDANATTVAITGDDQYLIQGYGELEVDILSADKAVPLKYATMTKYNLAISSISQDVTFTTSDIAHNLGVLGVNSDTVLNVKAIDSRGNFTTVPLTVKVVPYVIPQLTPTAQRVNNFETETDIHIEGVISQLTIDSVDKNAVNTTNGIQYRYKKTTDASWSSWVNVANSTSGANVSVTDFSVNLDRNFAWDMEFTLTDKLNTTTVALVVPVGIPIFRIGLDGHVYNNEQPLMISHVGQIIQSTTLTTASAVEDLYGGTWVAWGVGRVLVGVDTSQTEFNTVEKTGGHKLLQNHSHSINTPYGYIVGSVGGSYKGTGSGASETYAKDVTATGGGNAQNLQPYITAYQWKRTS